MTIRVRSKDFGVRRWPGGLAAPLLGPIAFTALALLGASLVPPPADSARLCSADRAVVEVAASRPSCGIVAGAGVQRPRPADRPA